MKNKRYIDLLKVIGIALAVSLVLYVVAGGGNVAPWIFLFYFIFFFYLGADDIRLRINEDKLESRFVNKNFQWLIHAVVFLAGVHVATGLTVSYLVDYCDGIFANEIRCELQVAEDGVYEKYRDDDYGDRENGLW